MLRRLAVIVALTLPGGAVAQDAATLADIRQELSILFVEVQRLQRELSTTGTPSVDLGGTGALERIDTMETELRRLTGRTEELQQRIERVVADGTNRIGDLQFRLCELEADCDIASLGATPPLGGEAAEAPAPAAPAPIEGPELAVGEQADFDRARTAFEAGDYARAAELLGGFAETYTGGPLTAEAHFLRGEALRQTGDEAGAARAYLAAFSGDPEGDQAPQALLRLGLSLERLGQRADACATLGEVTTRYPDAAASLEAQTARADLACG